MKILITGDFCPRYRLKEMLDNGRYEDVFGQVKPVFSQADYSIVNFECAVASEQNVPIAKKGPNLLCSESAFLSLKWLGADCVTLANNHFGDFGDEGVRQTIAVCKKNQVDYVGGGETLHEASRTLYKTIGKEKIAVISCCEHEFNLASATTGGSNHLDSVNQYYAIQEAKRNADYVIVIVHGGHEHYQLPSVRMTHLYRFFIDAGADAVVNHHQHCFSSYEMYHDRPIYYGTGNFCFDISPVKTDDTWNYGYMVQLNLFHGEVSSEMIPYKQCAEKPLVELLPPGSFDSKLQELCRITADEQLLYRNNQLFYETSDELMSMMLNSNKNRFLRVLSRFLKADQNFRDDYLLSLYNLVLCEAHRDKLTHFLESRYQKLGEK